ncbi:LysR family transcriptional regulator [Methylobacterium terricola]|uniref:LysR family transcriptional regulator n=1 Tax=Methylobacterium terricola TaxID=2583531 RepID=A0A5C4L4M1_9HYPH|nr:LysR family transcriptional regulator [Methylobacterium terricola]TNC04915.1 LysR family transcriptional regulator [Methylobacterium terricola]
MVRFTLRQCTYFRAVAENGGIAQAARALNISQPAVAQAIEKLEEVTGLRLFDRRHARGTTLTRHGRAFLQHAADLERQAEQVAREAAALASQVAGEIRLGCFATLAPFFAASLVRSHLDRHPGVRMVTRELSLTALAEEVRVGSLDIALTYDLGADLAGLSVLPLAALRPRVVIAADHPLAGKRLVSLRELAEEPYVMFDGPGSRGYFEDLLREHGIAPPIAYASTSLEAVRSAVGNGFGFTLLVMRPHTTTTYDLKSLKVLRLRDALRPLRIVLATRDQDEGDPLLGRFVDHCVDYFKARFGAPPAVDP